MEHTNYVQQIIIYASMSKILIAYCFIAFALILWPFKFVSPCRTCQNGAIWMAGKNGIEFETPGLLWSVSPPIGFHERLLSANGLTIVAWLKTAEVNQMGPARIVSYSQGPDFRNFTLAQENSDLVFRLRTTKTDLNGTKPEVTVPELFVPGQRQHIVVTYDSSHYRFYVDGQLLKSVPSPGGTFSNWDPAHRLLIGNEQTGDRPWLGSIERVVVYDRPFSAAEVEQDYHSVSPAPDFNGAAASFDFTMGEGNIIHDKSSVQPGSNLELPAIFVNEGIPGFLTLKPRYLMDFISNFLIFLPFGFLLYFSVSKIPDLASPQPLAIMLLATVLFTLTNESLQYYVDGRTSSLFDFASAIAGGASGILAAIALKALPQVS